MKLSTPKPSKCVVFVLIMLITLSGICLMLPRTHYIECLLDATKMQESTSIKEQTELTIVGEYKSSLFSADSFIGKVEIQELAETTGELLPVLFDSDQKNYGALTYRYNGELIFLGYMRMNKNASEVIICLFEDSGDGNKYWDPQECHVIAFPHNNISDFQEDLY